MILKIVCNIFVYFTFFFFYSICISTLREASLFLVLWTAVAFRFFFSPFYVLFAWKCALCQDLLLFFLSCILCTKCVCVHGIFNVHRIFLFNPSNAPSTAHVVTVKCGGAKPKEWTNIWKTINGIFFCSLHCKSIKSERIQTKKKNINNEVFLSPWPHDMRYGMDTDTTSHSCCVFLSIIHDGTEHNILLPSAVPKKWVNKKE